MKYFFMPVFFMLMGGVSLAQEPEDSVAYLGKKTITLSELVVDNQLNVPKFIEQVKQDSSFYKAFRNLHILGYTAINDIRMVNKKDELKAGLFSKIKQHRRGNCRYMETISEKISGDMLTDDGNWNYYTASMYAALFFAKDTLCGETNIVAGREFSLKGKRGMEKHKEQLKMLFFNPGKKIKGLPFLSNKTEIYDDNLAEAYDMSIDLEFYNGVNCYIFYQKVKPEYRNKVVVDEMKTWFDQENMEVMARTYSLNYRAGIYDFDVQMEVQMTRYKNLTVPALVRYIGNWKAITKKRERGYFTATISEFTDAN